MHLVISYFSLLSVVENSTQIISKSQPKDPNTPLPTASIAVTVAMDLNSTGYDFDASIAAMSNLCTSLPKYDQLLKQLKITKGPLKGGYKC